jgi:hypothetical protein
MKKALLLSTALLASGAVFAQKVQRAAPNERSVDASPARIMSQAEFASYYQAETVIWSEDFASGIPSTWMNYGTALGVVDPDAKWEYRGSTTTPNTSVGSRGAYSSQFLPGSTTPNPNYTSINSASKSNGFVVFDSDFLDNAGIASNFCGTGALACAPHVANLETSVINLTGHLDIELSFTQFYRRFVGGPNNSQAIPATYIDFSKDGGVTWYRSVTLNGGVAVNAATPSNDVVVINAKNFIGNEANAKIRFRFDGDYYHWQIDDIKIVPTPKNRLTFTAGSDGSPAQDIVYGANQESARMGRMTLKQVRPIAFDANCFNSGLNAQTNVKLQMKIFNATTGAMVQTINSPIIASLASGDTATWNQLNTYTTSWTPSAVGRYDFTYNLVSDSVSIASDTLGSVFVTDSLMSLDNGNWDNSIGASYNTTQWGDGSQMTNMQELVNDEMLFGARVYLSSTSQAGAVLELEVYDSSAFGANGFDANKLVAYGQRVLTASDITNGYAEYNFADTVTGRGVVLNYSNIGYYFNLIMFNNAGANRLLIRNDQTFGARPGTKYMYLPLVTTPGWFTGYTNSKVFNNLWIHSINCPASNAANCMTTSVGENPLNEVVLAPNPASDFVNVNFGLLYGEHAVEVLDLSGKVVRSTKVMADANVPIFVGDLQSGLYLVRIAKGGDVKTFKVSVL